MSDTGYETIINLEQSTFAHKFADTELIHQQEFERVMRMVEKQLKFAKEKYVKLENRQPHYYNTISVFGERGSGKTSFLHSVLAEVEDKYNKDVDVLGIIDPTLIEEKEHIFLLVVSIINERVKRYLHSTECGMDTKAFQQRKIWDEKLQRLAKGLPTLEKLGTDHKTMQWQSHEFIMERGLDAVYSAFNLERDFHELVCCALEILNKKAFLLALDDIDVDMKKGWDVLEMLRRYLTTPQILTLLSGNLKLYSLNVRKQQWMQLEVNCRFDEEKDYTKHVNELEGQYLLKILKSENRVHLYSILESMQLFAVRYLIKGYAKKEMYISNVYNDILNHFGICGSGQLSVFSNYLKSLSVRSQVQFMLSNRGKNRQGVESVEAFLSRLYAANVDVELAVNNAQMLSLLIQRYIEEHESAPDLYLLTPNNADDDINACLTAFTILFCKEVKNSPFLIFDYFVRMGYMRNVWLGLNNLPYEREDFYNHVGLKQMMSLKNNVGLSISYCLVYDSQLSSHIPLYALAGKNKQDKASSQGRFDYEVDTVANQGQNIISYLPLCIMKFTNKNETRLYYSFYNLLAVIAEILKAVRDGNRKETIKSLLMSLQLLRTYPIWNRDGDIQTKFVDEPAFEPSYSEEVNMKEETDDRSLDILTDEIIRWSSQYNESVPPYLLGKIVTRLYYTLQKIQEINLGDQMYRSTMAFLNACLIEEATEYYVKSDDGDGIDKLNLSNVITHDRYFRDNLRFVIRNKAEEKIKLTNWMIRCPLFWAFINVEELRNISFTVERESRCEDVFPFENGLSIEYNVYKILKSVRIKDALLIDFSAAKGRIHKTINILRRLDYDISDILNLENDEEEIATDINERQIFRNRITKKMIRDFRKNYDFGRVEQIPVQPAVSTTSSSETSLPISTIKPGKNLTVVRIDEDFKAIPRSTIKETGKESDINNSVKENNLKDDDKD